MSAVRNILNGFTTVYTNIVVTGQENIPNKHVLIISNHQHLLDPLLISKVFPGKATAIAKKSLFKIPVVGWAIKSLGALPVKRDGSDIKALRDAVKVLKESSLLVFAEGTRNPKEDTAAPAKPGSIMIAKTAGVDILPVTIKSTYRPFGKTKIHFHPLVKLSDYGIGKFKGEDYERIANEIMQTIYDKRKAL